MQEPSVVDLRALLTRVRRRWVTARTMRACARAVGLALALLLLVLAIDQFLRPDDTPMVGLAALAFLIAVVFAGRTLWPLRQIPTDIQVARFIEERCPDLEDGLATATEVVRTGPPSALGEFVVRDAATKARSVDANQVVTPTQVRRSILRGAATALAFILVFAVGNDSVSRIARSAWLLAFPSTASLDVEPGDVRIVVGDSVTIAARLDGMLTTPRTPPFVTLTDSDGETQTVGMEPSGGGYRAVIPSVDHDFTYRVSAATLTSDSYGVTAVFPPRVERINVAYEYPAFTNLPPREEADGGDVYAPEGTRVTLKVHVDKVVRRGNLQLETGGRIPLRAVEDHVLEASFTVSADDSYRVVAVDGDDLVSAADVDYFIRTVFDRPPAVEIVRPAGDREITPLEEVVIEANARDDFGLERFDLVYSVVGEAEREINLLSEARSRTAVSRFTLYGEELALEPGDFISYYARALDTNRGSGAGEVRSDIYFLQVRPFGLEFENAQSQSMTSADEASVANLAEVQKQIIVATWRLDRETPTDRPPDDVTAVADAQEELRGAASRLAQRLLARPRRRTPQEGAQPRVETEAEAMRQAVDAMTQAEVHLRDNETGPAVPVEMDALNQLLRAQVQIRRRQVSTERRARGQGRQNQAQEDLSALFDQELRRDQQTNYETRASAAEEPSQRESDAQRRLSELAERQEALGRAQEQLVGREDEIEADDLKRELERLTREQNALREEVEELARDLGSERRSLAQAGSDPTGEISEQMRRTMGDLRRGDLSQAARRSREVSEALQRLQQAMGGQSGAGGQEALGELRLKAQQLAELQRQLAEATRQSGSGPTPGPARQRLAGQGDQMADRVDALEDQIAGRRRDRPDRVGEALTAASDELRERDVAGRARSLADQLRRTVGPSPDPSEEMATVERIADESDTLAEALDQVAEHLASGDGRSARARQLADELEGVQKLQRSLQQLEEQLRQAAESSGQSGEERSADSALARPLGDNGSEQGANTRRERTGGPAGASASAADSMGPLRLAELQGQLMRQLEGMPELLERLSRQRATALQDLDQWAQHWETPPAPGTEAAKQDFSVWGSLRDDLRVALESFVAARSGELRDEEIGDRLIAGASDRMPEEYRRRVEDYYRSIAARDQCP